MPFYKYVCEKCGHTEEILCCCSEKESKLSELRCEKCQGTKFSQVFTRTLVASGHKEIPQEHHPAPEGSGCSSCSGGSCGSCGL